MIRQITHSKTRNPVGAFTKRVFVGLSGGVDSAVSAALLIKAGYDVTGVYIKVWQPDWIHCTWKEERRDAMRVAAHLNIPFVTLDLVNEYKRGVIDYMLAEYAAGRTPNPDVMCNREVKFGGFWQWAHKNGADFVATGHYARISGGKIKRMLAGIDKNKDQSYFLWTLNQGDLKHILFPVGHLEKPRVRTLAKKFGLPNADKKDSQGLCFIGKIDIKEFLAHYIKNSGRAAKLGKVLDLAGEVIGKHPGALFFTLGERHAFTITKKTTHDGRYYVVAKDMKKNTITVGSARDTGRLMIPGDRFAFSNVDIINTNWTRIISKIGSTVQVRTRYRQQLIGATVLAISGKNKRARLKLESSTDPITPGQSLVIYKGEECLGGGIIL